MAMRDKQLKGFEMTVNEKGQVISAEMIIRLFNYSVSMTLFDSLTHYSNNHYSTLYTVFRWKSQP